MRTSIITLAVCAAALLVPGMAQAATITYTIVGGPGRDTI
jgi:hypothetical protein